MIQLESRVLIPSLGEGGDEHAENPVSCDTMDTTPVYLVALPFNLLDPILFDSYPLPICWRRRLPNPLRARLEQKEEFSSLLVSSRLS